MSNGTNAASASRRITIDQILNSNQDAQPELLPRRGRQPAPGVGLLSRTLFKSSMTKWILSARIRSRHLHELLFIGENEVRIKEILPNGDLRRLTTLKNFPSQIRAAAVIGEDLELTATTDDPFVKMENSQGEPKAKILAPSGLPPQVLVLALESAELRFVIFDTSHQDGVHFWQTSFPLPIYRSLYKTPGRTISVDPLARALIVSASSNTILVFNLKSRATLEAEYAINPNQWNPICQERQLYVDGSVLAIDFLHPGPGRENHIVLVIVAIVGGVSRLSCYQWEQARGLEGIRPVVESIRLPKSETDSSASSEFRSPTETAPEHCNLMIPMANSPSFLLVHGSDVRICRNILSGTPDVIDVPARAWEQDPRHWASSSRRPAYTAWTRCARIASWKNRGNESLYLIREDGVIRNYTRGNDLGTGSLGNAGQFDCTVSTAVSSFLLHLSHPDFLVAAGDMCNGQVVSFGDGGTSNSREEAMAMKVRRTFPDWAPIMDLQVVSPTGQIGDELSKRSNIFATSGRQPYGAISELRKGLEAKILIEADLGQSDGLKGSYGLWSFPDPFDRGIHFFLTYPGATTAWILSTEDEMEPSELNLDPESDTLLATITPNHFVIQVTENSLFVSLLVCKSPPSPLEVPDIPQGSRIVAADFDEESSGLLLAVRNGDRVYLDLFVVPETLGCRTVIRVSAPLALDADLTCLSLFRDHGVLCAVTALRDGTLHLFSIGLSTGVSALGKTSIEQSGSTQIAPVAQAVLVMSKSVDTTRIRSQLVVCGLRNGDLFTVEIEISGHGVQILPSWENPKTIKLGTGPISLSRYKSSSAFALCGYDTCRLDYVSSTKGLVVSSIFLTDPTNPDLAWPKLSALRTLVQPDSNITQIACIDGSTLRIADLDDSLRVIPRRIPLNKNVMSPESLGALVEPSGTPQKLLYSPRLEALVIGSVKYERKAPSTTYPGPRAPYLGMRTNRGALQFMPLDNEDIPSGVGEVQPIDKSTLIELLPGERPMTMVEFKYRRDADKLGYYHFLLAGTKRTHEDGTQTGRLLFLRPNRLPNGTIKVDLPIARTYDFPIRALAICDTKIVMSHNKNITVYELANIPQRGLRLNTLCSVNLTSHAINLTTSSPFICVTTAADSIQTFKLLPTSSAHEPAQINYNLILFSSDSISRETLIHLPLHIPLPSTLPSRTSSSPISALLNTPSNPNIVLASDRSGTVFALSHPETQTYQTASQTLFELTLPQCVTHFAKSPSIRPPWCRITDPGVLEADILGSCTDGTTYQFSIVDNKTRLLLKFLENLVKWDREEDTSSAQGGRWFGMERVVIDPEWEDGEQKRKTGYAINGDFIEVFLEEDGAKVLKAMLTREIGHGGEEFEGHRRWNGNEMAERKRRFGELLTQILGEDAEWADLDERVEKCVEWLGGIMVEML